MKYEAMACLYAYGEHSIAKMARALEVKDSAYHQWKRRQEKNELKRQAEKELIDKVREVFNDNKQVYGYRKMQDALADESIFLSEYKVRKIMKENGLFSVVGHKWRPAKSGKATGRYLDNMLNQNFKVAAPNMVWVGDITYIKTSIGWVYLAIVLDLCTKEIIGYSISRRISTELIKRALANALAICGRDPKVKIVFHSDRGTQYASKSFQKMCRLYNLTQSMSKPACPFDNACAEAFFSVAKREEIYRRRYRDIDDVRFYLFEYIELFYNRKRKHAGLGNRSPKEYRTMLEIRRAA